MGIFLFTYQHLHHFTTLTSLRSFFKSYPTDDRYQKSEVSRAL